MKREYEGITSDSQILKYVSDEKGRILQEIFHEMDNNPSLKEVYIVSTITKDQENKKLVFSVNKSLVKIPIEHIPYNCEQYVVSRDNRNPRIVNVTFEVEYGMKLLSNDSFCSEQFALAESKYSNETDSDKKERAKYFLIGIRDTYSITEIMAERYKKEILETNNKVFS
ncbi:MAG: hypothetical protein ACRCXT_00505 [Paraclostridium sp.]